MKGTIISVGDEILVGQIENTNATWLAETLSGFGIEIEHIISVGDDEITISEQVLQAISQPGLIVVTGGLGPTHDDVTRAGLCRAFNTTLELHARVENQIKQRLASRGRGLSESRRRMAYIPEGFSALANPIGLAPGLLRNVSPEHLLVVLPGVPAEMKAIVQQHLAPILERRSDTAIVRRRTLLTAGITESQLAERLEEKRVAWSDEVALAFLPGYRSGVRLRLTVRDKNAGVAEKRLREAVDDVTDVIRPYLYGVDDDTLEAVVGRILSASSKTVAVAESCTGGLVSDRLTDIPGSSIYMLGGIVAYSNAAKERFLGVDPRAIEQHGAVSRDVATAMARGVRERFGASIGLSATGVAGPGGGSPEKPVGTVWIAYADRSGESALRLRLLTDRRLNKEMTATAVLSLLWRKLVSE